MGSAIALSMDNFNNSSDSRLRKEISQNLKNAKLRMLKTILADEDISFDNQITSYNKLKKLAFKNLSKSQIEKINGKINDAQNEIKFVIDSMQITSNTSFQTIVDNINNNVVSPLAKCLALSITSGITYAILQTLPIPIKKITGAIGISGMIYKGTKAYIKSRNDKMGKIYDKVIEKMELKKDDNGRIIDTRFNNTELHAIKQFFDTIGVDINISDYENVKEKINDLNNDNKLKIINILNNQNGNNVNVINEIEKHKKKQKMSFIKIVMDCTFSGRKFGKCS